METNISDGAIEFSVKNCIAGESYRFGAKKYPALASNPEVSIVWWEISLVSDLIGG